MDSDAPPQAAVPAPATVLDRMLAGGISEDRARKWIEIGAVYVDGTAASTVDHPAPSPARWVIKPS